MLLGALVIVSPFLGFPSGTDTAISIIIGLIIIAVAYRMDPNKKPQESESSAMPYVEHHSSTADSNVKTDVPSAAGVISENNPPVNP
jgi:hypothetical protein